MQFEVTSYDRHLFINNCRLSKRRAIGFAQCLALRAMNAEERNALVDLSDTSYLPPMGDISPADAYALAGWVFSLCCQVGRAEAMAGEVSGRIETHGERVTLAPASAEEPAVVVSFAG